MALSLLIRVHLALKCVKCGSGMIGVYSLSTIKWSVITNYRCDAMTQNSSMLGLPGLYHLTVLILLAV